MDLGLTVKGSHFWSLLRTDRVAMIAGGFLMLLVIVAIFAPVISPQHYASFDFHQSGARPQLSWQYLFGADVQGHSILMYVILGARTTFGIALLSTIFSVVGGGFMGMVAGYFKGWIDGVLSYVLDGAFTLPFLPLVLVLIAYTSGGGPWWIVLIFAVIGSLAMAGAFRKAADVKRCAAGESTVSRLYGAVSIKGYSAQLEPRSTRAIVRLTVLLLSAFVVTEATVDFLGFGLPPSDPSWGTGLQTVAYYFEAGFWWWLLFPGIALFFTVFAINLLGCRVLLALEAAEASGSDRE